VGYYNISSGGCGWDGTCTDTGQIPAVLVGWLVVPAVEVAVGLLISRLSAAIVLGCACVAVLAVQGVLINAWASARGGADIAQANFYVQVSLDVVGAEIAVALLALVMLRYLRRQARQT
jgi:mannose/fructose/N-acetylgalactosamine-specific phosphotransferase system component IID